jgi:hypothetical protein
MTTDFLGGPTPSPAALARDEVGFQQLEQSVRILTDIRRELLKLNPTVWAELEASGSRIIPAGDTSSKKLTFQLGGKPVTIYRLLCYSTFSGDVAISPASLSSIMDGFSVTAAPAVLSVALHEIHVLSDGSADLPLNGPAGATDGGLYLYGFTIPIFDAFDLDRPNTVV